MEKAVESQEVQMVHSLPNYEQEELVHWANRIYGLPWGCCRRVAVLKLPRRQRGETHQRMAECSGVGSDWMVVAKVGPDWEKWYHCTPPLLQARSFLVVFPCLLDGDPK